MATVVEINTARKQAGLPLIRFNIRRYSDQDVADLREAFAAMYEISDIAAGDLRGYWAVARGHGYDQYLCHTDPTTFLTWHRGFVYWFEKALNTAFQWKRNDLNTFITLPYWDWTIFDAASDATNGIPKAVNDPTYDPGDGSEARNPLQSAKSLYRIENQGLTGDDEYTHRYPSQLRGGISWLAQQVAGYYDQTDFSRFNTDFDGGAHGAVHVWVGGADSSSPLPRNSGDMSAVVSAAYDPIFWLHHCMVDRVFYNWQKLHGNSTVSQHVREAMVYGCFSGQEVLESEEFLMVTYGDAPAGASGADTDVDTGDEEAPLPPTMTVPLSGLTRGIRWAHLYLQGMRPPRKSYEVRVFVGGGSADKTTATTDNPNHAGTLFIFGHGECSGAPGHCNPNLADRGQFDRRPGHPLQKKNYSLEVTKAVQTVASELIEDRSNEEKVTLYFVVLDAAGNQVAPEELDFDSISLVAD